MRFLNLINTAKFTVPLKKIDDIFNNPSIDKKLRELKSLVSCTPDEYKKFYIKPLENYDKQLNKLSHLINKDKKAELFHCTLENIVDCLKLRQGYMLPVGADAETCYKEQEAWTYAIFTAALIRYSGILLIEILLPADGLTVLSQNSELFESWLMFMSHDEFHDSALIDIFSRVKKIKKAEHKKLKKDLPSTP